MLGGTLVADMLLRSGGGCRERSAIKEEGGFVEEAVVVFAGEIQNEKGSWLTIFGMMVLA